MAQFTGLKKGENGTIHINEVIPTDGTPVNAVASQGTLTIPTQPTATDTMTIGDKVFTFVADGSEAADGDITVGTNLATAQAAIVAAINGTDSINTASEYVTAAAFATNTSVLTAITKGTSGDVIATTETFVAVGNVFDAATLGTTTAGVDGTIAARGGTCYADDTYLYYCLQPNTISDNYWRRISLGSAY